MPGPYFSGQQPAECGHYYPDVLHLRDEKRPDGTFVRIVDCIYCGRYELPLDIQILDKALARKLKKKGFEIEIQEAELSEVREKALKEFSLKANYEERAAQMFQSFLEEAIASKAESIELEYVDEGLEVIFMAGNFGLGNIVKDHKLVGEIINLIVKRAKVQNKSRGVINWEYRGGSYRITVVKYEDFGESAFKLRLDKSGRRHA